MRPLRQADPEGDAVRGARATKAQRRARRFGARIQRDSVGMIRKRRTGRRGRRISQQVQGEMTGSGAAVLLDAIDRLPKRTPRKSDATKRAERDAKEHRAIWGPEFDARAAADRAAARRERG